MNAGNLLPACRCSSSVADCLQTASAGSASLCSSPPTSASELVLHPIRTSPRSNKVSIGPPSDHTPRRPWGPPARQQGRAAPLPRPAPRPPPAAGVMPGPPESPGARAGPRRRPLRPAARPPPARPAGAAGCPSTPGCARRRPPCTPAGGLTCGCRAPPCLWVLPALLLTRR